MAARLPAPRRREQLLDVALHVFASQGFHQTSMNDVADAAGVTKPVLYQHFVSKRALFHELLESVCSRLMGLVTHATSVAAGPREQVENGLRAYFQFVADCEDGYQLMFGGGTRRDPEFAKETLALERAFAEVIAGLIDVEGLDDEDRLLLAHGIVGLAEGTSRHWVSGAFPRDPSVVAARLADLAWRGLRGVRTETP